MAVRPSELDDIDLELLKVLRDDGRISVTQLAKQLHVSRANAYARMQRLQSDGVIRGFTAVVDPERIGLDTMAIVMMTAGGGGRWRWREFSEKLSAMPEVECAALVTGHADVVVVVRASDPRQLRRLLLERLQGLPHITSTISLLVLDEVVHRPYVLPEPAAGT